jgi:ribosomal protein S18 acetylase RimI-like enzyme
VTVTGAMHNGRVTDVPGSDDRPVTLRTATADDIDAVLALWLAAGAHPTSTDDERSVAALLARDPDALVLAEMNGRLVGTLIATWDGWRGSMCRLAVLPECRRHGIAARLVGQGEQRLQALGCHRVQALVVDSDARALAFWTGVDYVPDRLRRHVNTLGDRA